MSTTSIGFCAQREEGRELEDRGWSDDLAYATAHDVSAVTPELVGDHFVDASSGGSRSEANVRR